MTQKEEKEWSKMVPRFKDVCCTRMCSFWNSCKDREVSTFLGCPWFWGYRMYGWPFKRLSDYSYNAIKYPDLRVEDASDEFINEWKHSK